jgi:hypothetical protein
MAAARGSRTITLRDGSIAEDTAAI